MPAPSGWRGGMLSLHSICIVDVSKLMFQPRALAGDPWDFFHEEFQRGGWCYQYIFLISVTRHDFLIPLGIPWFVHSKWPWGEVCGRHLSLFSLLSSFFFHSFFSFSLVIWVVKRYVWIYFILSSPWSHFMIMFSSSLVLSQFLLRIILYFRKIILFKGRVLIFTLFSSCN